MMDAKIELQKLKEEGKTVEDEKASLHAYVEARFSLIQTEIEKKFG
jgi:hypothetical protein